MTEERLPQNMDHESQEQFLLMDYGGIWKGCTAK